MSEPIDSMPILPIADMLRDADMAWRLYEDDNREELLGDLACYVRSLVAELRKAAEACALAHQHLDAYGVVSGDNSEVEKANQERVFEATGPFSRAVGHGFVSIYREVQ